MSILKFNEKLVTAFKIKLIYSFNLESIAICQFMFVYLVLNDKLDNRIQNYYHGIFNHTITFLKKKTIKFVILLEN